MIKVFLREKKLLHGKKGLYLDFYPAIIHPETRKQTRREHLRLYVYERPRTEAQREHNKETRLLGENIKAQRQLEVQAGAYGFVTSRSRQKSFVAYLQEICVAKKDTSQSNQDHWRAIRNHFIKFAGESVRFADLTDTLCSDFKEYLWHGAGLNKNTAASYFDSFRSAVKGAFEKKMLTENPARGLKGIPPEDAVREFLTLAELQQVAITPFEPDAFKRAAIFSAMSGLSFADLLKLTWEEVQHSTEQGSYIRFRRKKTGSGQTLPVSPEAVEILGDRGQGTVFPTLKKWHCTYYLPRLMVAARIMKPFTFHCFRHTYATLQLTLGTDIYTVSKLLGHKRVETTQIYAKIIDQKKREAADRITLQPRTP